VPPLGRRARQQPLGHAVRTADPVPVIAILHIGQAAKAGGQRRAPLPRQ
jgi:hypothetical protein